MKESTIEEIFELEWITATLETVIISPDHSYIKLHVKEAKTDRLLGYTYYVLDADVHVEEFVKKLNRKVELIALLDDFTREMEGYSYFGSNPGISTDDYEDVADRIMEKYFLK
jgi:hypothetical protein